MTPVEICNAALSCIGEDRIQSLAEADIDSDAEQQCFVNFPILLRVALEAREWSFATGWLKIEARDAVAPVHPLDVKRWLLPATVLRVLKVDDGSGMGIQYRKEGRYLLSDPGDNVEVDGTRTTKPLYVRAISLVEDPDQWSPNFGLAVSYLLASKLAVPLTDSTKQRDDLYKLYTFQLQQAAVLDGMQGSPEQRGNVGPRPSNMRG